MGGFGGLNKCSFFVDGQHLHLYSRCIRQGDGPGLKPKGLEKMSIYIGYYDKNDKLVATGSFTDKCDLAEHINELARSVNRAYGWPLKGRQVNGSETIHDMCDVMAKSLLDYESACPIYKSKYLEFQA